MRKILFVGVLATLLVVVSMFPFFKSGASNQDKSNASGIGRRLPPGPLPNYDIRLEGDREFADYDLSSPGRAPNIAAQARRSAVDEFRSRLRPEDSDNLRATVNEAGAMKNFFIDGATLSFPQSDTPDNIARGFLRQHASLFALSEADVADLAVVNEDNDRGTTFLKYVQTIEGIKVFEGEVRVAVNKNGEVLSVSEGFLVSGLAVKLKGAMSEKKGIAKAFEYAGTPVDDSFVETHTRAAKGEMSRFANPLATDNEDVLAELSPVVRAWP